MVIENTDEIWCKGSTFDSYLEKEGRKEEIDAKVKTLVSAYNGDFLSFKKIVSEYKDTHRIKFYITDRYPPICGFLFKEEDDGSLSFRERHTYVQSIRRTERLRVDSQSFVKLYYLEEM